MAAAVWLVQRGIQIAASRRATRAQKRGDRRAALGILAGATLGRVWLIALAVLLVGLAEREAGLAAAVLSAVLFTVYLGPFAAPAVSSPPDARSMSTRAKVLLGCPATSRWPCCSS